VEFWQQRKLNDAMIYITVLKQQMRKKQIVKRKIFNEECRTRAEVIDKIEDKNLMEFRWLSTEKLKGNDFRFTIPTQSFVAADILLIGIPFDQNSSGNSPQLLSIPSELFSLAFFEFECFPKLQVRHKYLRFTWNLSTSLRYASNKQTTTNSHSEL
jgi:hypothetical protein